MLSLRRRLSKLERSPYFQRPPDSFDPITMLALDQLTDEQLDLLILVVRDREAGLCRTLSYSESTAEAAYRAALNLIRAGELT
jgi:hypothetical protein